MALSKSWQNKGQAILSCQMCEEENQIKWKCLTCNFLMCNKCCKIHEKFKSSEEHKIVDLKDIAAHQEESESLDFTNIRCQIHSGQKCCIFCKACQEVICPLCIAETHNMHKLVPLQDGYDFAIKNLNYVSSNLDKELVKTTSNMAVLESMKSKHISYCENEKLKILNHERDMEEKLHNNTKKLLLQLDESKKEFVETIDNDVNNTKQVQVDLVNKKKKFFDIISSRNVSDVFRLSKEYNKLERPDTKQIDQTKYRRMPKFNVNEVRHSEIESIFGCLSLSDEEIPVTPDVKFEVVKSVKSNLPEVQTMLYCPDGSLWISRFEESGTLQNVSLTKHSLKVNKNVNLAKVAEVKMTKHGELLVSAQKSRLFVVNPISMKVSDSLYSVAPFITNSALHISKSNNIIVGAREFGPPFPVSGPRMVIVMNSTGEHVTTYNLDNQSKPIFTCPGKITTDNNDHIFVIDKLAEDFEGRVIKLKPSEGISHIYYGGPEQKKFFPYDLLCTKADNVIVSDDENDRLHILNNEIQCIYSIATQEIGINWPMALDIDNNGLLFVGCGSREENTSYAKIHVVKFSGF